MKKVIATTYNRTQDYMSPKEYIDLFTNASLRHCSLIIKTPFINTLANDSVKKLKLELKHANLDVNFDLMTPSQINNVLFGLKMASLVKLNEQFTSKPLELLLNDMFYNPEARVLNSLVSKLMLKKPEQIKSGSRGYVLIDGAPNVLKFIPIGNHNLEPNIENPTESQALLLTMNLLLQDNKHPVMPSRIDLNEMSPLLNECWNSGSQVPMLIYDNELDRGFIVYPKKEFSKQRQQQRK